jgi:hypothetical protein
MSTVSNISTSNPYQAYPVGSKNTAAQALVAAGTALQSGSISDTTPATAPGQAVVEEAQTTTKPAPTNAQADADYSNLVNDVQNGDLSDAQAALAKLQIDLKGAHGGHHHHAEAASPAPTAVTTDTLSSTTDSSGSTSDSNTSGNYVNVTV